MSNDRALRGWRDSRHARALRAAVVLACASALGCHPPQLDPGEVAIFNYWLACFDCNGQLDSVRVIASRKPAPAVANLDSALVYGPPLSSVSDSALLGSFVRDSTWRARHGRPSIVFSRTEYIADERARFGNGYRVHAAIALGWIHTASAVHSLDSALALPLEPDVANAVRYAIDSLPRP